jgi:phosphatidylethanolamine-binding protein (PEBP) family uncharacterized protein
VRRSRWGISCAPLALALALAGCGSAGSSGDAPTHIEVSSSAIKGTTLPALYTCDGKDIPPPVEWSAVPAGTEELVLLVIGLKPAAEAGSYSASIEWAVAGINPALHRLPSGRLPRGAYVGENSAKKRGYSICPQPGASERYQFQLYAMPPRIRVAREFVGMSVLGTLNQPGTSDSATGQGAFVVNYTRQ